ncbi:MAG: aldehyde ferredoxin oxidoreductase family protein [Anaerolineae bacterium]|nr:aldehyde ferredoxin oxidoreductase family protein [Anaerolineae bacterium]
MSSVYAGQYLKIDLDSGDVHAVPISDADVPKFFLGSGYAAKLYAEEMEPEVGPLDPRNPIYIFNGLLSGTFAPTGCRSSWCGRSPLTGIWNEANVGGHFGAELRAAGLDGLVISGRAEQPVYLYLHDGTAEVRDAGLLWGMDTFETHDRLLAETDAKARAAVIGPVGEALVHFAAVIQGGRSHSRAAGRGGIGAMLGSKRLKGIVAHGRERPAYADRQAFSALVRELTPCIRDGSKGASMYGTAGGMSGTEFTGDLPIHNWQGGSWEEGAAAISGQTLHETYWVKDTHCHACPIGCGKAIEIDAGPYAGVRGEGPEYETLAGFGAMLKIDDLAAVSRANDLCNRLGLDTISTSSTIAFAFEAFENGLITADEIRPDDEAEGRPLAWGDAAGMLKLIELIAARRGAGRYLADGVRAAAAHLGRGADAYAIHVKGLEMAYHDPRAFFSMAANYATANRGACHLEALSYWPMYGVDASSWAPEPYDRFDDEGAGRQAAAFQDYLSLYNPLGLCKFIGKVGLSPEMLGRLVQAAAGWALDGEQMMRTGERIFNLKRLINNRLGITRADDTLPRRLLTQARPSGQAEGRLPNLELMLEEYYEVRGWLPDGRPSPERLQALGLDKMEGKDEILFG